MGVRRSVVRNYENECISTLDVMSGTRPSRFRIIDIIMIPEWYTVRDKVCELRI